MRIFEISDRIELLLQYSIRSSTVIRNFQILTITNLLHLLTEWCRFFTLATMPSNQQNQQTWSCLLAHYGPASTETPTTETTTVQCHKNSWIYLTSTYYWWLLRRTITIWFNSKFQIIAQLFDSIQFEMKKHYSHSTRNNTSLCPDITTSVLSRQHTPLELEIKSTVSEKKYDALTDPEHLWVVWGNPPVCGRPVSVSRSASSKPTATGYPAVPRGSVRSQQRTTMTEWRPTSSDSPRHDGRLCHKRQTDHIVVCLWRLAAPASRACLVVASPPANHIAATPPLDCYWPTTNDCRGMMSPRSLSHRCPHPAVLPRRHRSLLSDDIHSPFLLTEIFVTYPKHSTTKSNFTTIMTTVFTSKRDLQL